MQGLGCSGQQPRVVREAKVVVATEIEQPFAGQIDFAALRPGPGFQVASPGVGYRRPWPRSLLLDRSVAVALDLDA